jgi:hypothetical protein
MPSQVPDYSNILAKLDADPSSSFKVTFGVARVFDGPAGFDGSVRKAVRTLSERGGVRLNERPDGVHYELEGPGATIAAVVRFVADQLGERDEREIEVTAGALDRGSIRASLELSARRLRLQCETFERRSLLSSDYTFVVSGKRGDIIVLKDSVLRTVAHAQGRAYSGDAPYVPDPPRPERSL